jgi:hypothetical protein
MQSLRKRKPRKAFGTENIKPGSIPGFFYAQTEKALGHEQKNRPEKQTIKRMNEETGDSCFSLNSCGGSKSGRRCLAQRITHGNLGKA